MFEVVITLRSDFTEHPVGRFATMDEARAQARRIAEQEYQKIVRARVRVVPQVRNPAE